MEENLLMLLSFALSKHASDIHFVLSHNTLQIKLRKIDGIEELHQDFWNKNLFEYLKFISGFDLTSPYLPQSGQFVRTIQNKTICFRFSMIYNQNLQTGVLRMLNTKKDLKIEELTHNKTAVDFMRSLTHCRQGLILSSGPTNSGKTTTIHAILHEIAVQSAYKVVSLEDPIEIEDESYLQLQINEAQGFTYEKGIEELMRHDPDVIFIGEIRNPTTAAMTLRIALSGHLCFGTIHSSTGRETVQRLLDFGLDEHDLQNTLTAILAQRLYKTADGFGRECIYEICEKPCIQHILKNYQYPKGHKDLAAEIETALEHGIIADRQARYDLVDLQK
jgi:type II secretory ATPase GspE/PulE/Tfp pilus assembly ATPase PilB-like protein